MALVLLGTGLLGACAFSSNDPKLHTLTPAGDFNPAQPRVSWQLQVDAPLAAAGLDTTRIALRSMPTSLDYFAGVAWIDRAPQMIQSLLVESFENTSRILAVGRDTLGLRADYVLRSDLRDFQVEFSGQRRDQPPRAHVRLSVKLIAMPRRAVQASDVFDAVVQARSLRFDDVIAAFDQALNQVLRQTVEWTLARSSGPAS